MAGQFKIMFNGANGENASRGRRNCLKKGSIGQNALGDRRNCPIEGSKENKDN
jgi:hypothetical protein